MNDALINQAAQAQQQHAFQQQLAAISGPPARLASSYGGLLGLEASRKPADDPVLLLLCDQ